MVRLRFAGMIATAIILAAATPAALPWQASAQSNTPASAPAAVPEAVSETIHAKIEAIDFHTRQVTLDQVNGPTLTVTAAAQVPLDVLQVGDRVDIQYYRSVAFLVSKSSDSAKAQGSELSGSQLPPDVAQLLGQNTQAQIPGGVTVQMTEIVGMVVRVQPSTQMVDIVNPTGGRVYTLQVTDPSRAAMLSSLQIGDMVTAVISPPIATSMKTRRGLPDIFKWRS